MTILENPLGNKPGTLLKNGMTLNDHRNAVLERTEKTGYYDGRKELTFKDTDPIGFERIFSKVRAGVVNSREVAKKIAASPIVEQEGELCFTLYNVTGDCVVTSTGIIIHVGTMGAAIKYMIQNDWESNPGINEGDMFTNNDCQTGNVHPCDIATIVPIFHDGVMVAWVGGVTHVIDTGAVGPGSMSNGQIQRFGDGLQITCRKTGINDTPLRDYLHESQRNVRTTKYWILDEKTRIAGCHMIRDMVLETRNRLDGRALNEVRQIWSEVDFVPTAHGSSLFTRGETQSMTTVTLGSKLDEQMLDSPNLQGYNKFLLHYNFPAYSVGEARPNRGPGRREIGHGNLAERGIKRMLPDEMDYTIRIVSDITESNGSSSMATVCAGSMALMDAGIKTKGGVSGIAMGMISDAETGKYAILSDILGDEDHLGDMDFKVVGNASGIFACQMDIKVDGLSYEVLEEALMQAKEGRMHILGEMEKTIGEAREDLKPHTPRIVKFTIDKDKIGAVIGSGGKVIQELQETTNTTITIDEVDGRGVVEVLSADKDGLDAAISQIEAICADPEVGETYVGTVKNIMDFGAFIEFMPGREGLLHISEITWERLESMDGVLESGEEVKVKLLDIDEKTGKFKLSRKVLLEKPEGYVERPPRPPRRDNNRNQRRDNRKPYKGGGGNRRNDDRRKRSQD